MKREFRVQGLGSQRFDQWLKSEILQIYQALVASEVMLRVSLFLALKDVGNAWVLDLGSLVH